MTLLTSGWRPWWLDLRSLAASRVLLALCVLADVALRLPLARVFYSDAGLLPRQAVIGSPLAWSPFFMSGSAFWAAGLFLVMALLAAGLLLGWRARLCALLLCVLSVGMHLRNPFVNNAGDVLLSLGLAWFALLPVSACWSLDRAAVRTPGAASLRRGVYHGPAALGLTLQLAATYLFNHFYKTDPVWLGGQAVTQVLSRHLYSRDHVAALAATLPAPLLSVLGRTVWWLEFAAVFLLLVPSQLVRLLTVLALIGMHLGFAALLSIGLFPFVCVSLLVALLPGGVWNGRQGGSEGGLHGVQVYGYQAGSRAGYVLALLRRSLAGDEAAPVRPAPVPEVGWWAALRRGPFLWPLLLPALVISALAPVLRVARRSGWVDSRLALLVSRARPLLHSGWLTPGRLVPGRRKWALGLLLASAVPLYNLADYWALFPAQTLTSSFAAGIGQRWALFAPSPRYEDGYFVIRGHGDHGEEYDLFRRLVLRRPELTPGHVEMADALGAGFLGLGSEITRKFFEASVNQPGAGLLRAYVRDALCRDARAAGEPVRLVSFTFMEFSGSGQQTTPRDRAVLPCPAVLAGTKGP